MQYCVKLYIWLVWFYDDNFPLLIFCLSRKWDLVRVSTTGNLVSFKLLRAQISRLVLFTKWSTTGGERDGITEGDHFQPAVTEKEVRRQYCSHFNYFLTQQRLCDCRNFSSWNETVLSPFLRVTNNKQEIYQLSSKPEVETTSGDLLPQSVSPSQVKFPSWQIVMPPPLLLLPLRS